MTNAEWWAGVVASRTEHDALTIQPAWILHLDGHHAAIAGHKVANIAAEIMLVVDGDWRRTRLSRTEQQADLENAIADTRAPFEAEGWR